MQTNYNAVLQIKINENKNYTFAYMYIFIFRQNSFRNSQRCTETPIYFVHIKPFDCISVSVSSQNEIKYNEKRNEQNYFLENLNNIVRGYCLLNTTNNNNEIIISLTITTTKLYIYLNYGFKILSIYPLFYCVKIYLIQKYMKSHNQLLMAHIILV